MEVLARLALHLAGGPGRAVRLTSPLAPRPGLPPDNPSLFLAGVTTAQYAAGLAAGAPAPHRSFVVLSPRVCLEKIRLRQVSLWGINKPSCI